MDSLRERVRRFYARWNPENIGNVDNIVASFGDREEVLWEQLARKYGPDAVRLSAQEQVAAAVAAPPPPPPAPGVLSGSRRRASRTPSDHGSAFDGVEAGREARASSRTHEACCARRALVGLSAGGKDHLNVHGGLFSVLNACGPLFQLHASPGVRKAEDTFVLVQALGPESVGDADRGKLGDGDRDDALRVLGRVIRAAKRLDAATSKQKVPRPRPREKRPRAEAAPRAEEPPPREPAERDDDDDVVVTGERSAEEARAPRDVVDLTSDEPPAKRVKAEPAPRPLAAFDAANPPAPPRAHARGPPPRSALKKASSSSRKSARFADAPDAAPGAGAGSAARRPARPPAEPEAPRRSRSACSKRMDRAIWDAFKSRTSRPQAPSERRGRRARQPARGETRSWRGLRGRDDLCRLLLAAGADPAHADNHGATAAYLARGKNHGTLAALLEGVSLNPALAAVAAPGAAAVAASPRKPPRAGDERHPSTLPPEDRGDDAPPPAEDDVSTKAALSPEDRAIVGAA
ncbi:adenosine deaminase [Aureococcus anophagefferens]|nr:adenosine deaminase [Aureococcus anophagefferens]